MMARLILMICSLISYAESSVADQQATFRIGVLAPKTGFMSGHGQSIEMGAKVAEATLNKQGGILGRPVEVVIADSTSEPAGAAERAQELIQRQNVSLLIGTGTSASTLAVVPVIEKFNIPFIYSLDGELKTCRLGDPEKVSNLVWGSGFTERMIVEPFLKYLAEKFSKPKSIFRIYLIGGDYVYPRSTNTYVKTVAEKLGYEVLAEEYSDTATQNYTPVIRRILKAKPDLLIVTNPGASGVTFMRQAAQFGLLKTIHVSGFATFDQEAIDAMGTASEGVYAVNRYSNQLESKENKSFIESFRQMYPNKPLLPGPTAAAGAYGSIMVAAKAFNIAQSTAPAKFNEKMRGLQLDLPQGSITVNQENNIFDQPIYIMRIKKQSYEVVADLGIQKHHGLEGCSVK
jgi:urea transport system substrate-binding protein